MKLGEVLVQMRVIDEVQLKNALDGVIQRFGLQNVNLANMTAAQMTAYADERQAMLRRMMETGAIAAAERAAWNYSVGPAGQEAAKMAVRQRYYTHMFEHRHPGRAELNHEFSQQFFNKDNIAAATGNSLQDFVQSLLRGGLGR